MTTTVTIRPNATIAGTGNGQTGWLVAGGGTHHAAVANDDLGVYVQGQSVWSSSGASVTNPGQLVLGLPDVALPAGALVSRITVTAIMENQIGTGKAVDVYTRIEPNVAPPVAGEGNQGVTLTPVPGAPGEQVGVGLTVLAGSFCSFQVGFPTLTPITQTHLNNMRVVIGMGNVNAPGEVSASAFAAVYGVKVEVTYETPGVVTIVGPVEAVRTATPIILVDWTDLPLAVAPSGITVVIYPILTAVAPGFNPWAPGYPGAASVVTGPFVEAVPTPSRLGAGVHRVFVGVGKVLACSSGAYIGSVDSFAQRDINVVAPAALGVRPSGAPAVLGCGMYQAVVQPRGGGPSLGVLPITSVGGTVRCLNETALVTLGVAAPYSWECRDLLTQITPWEHEVVVLRDGRELFVGVPGNLQSAGGTVTVPVQDLSCWLDARLVRVSRRFGGLDLSQVLLMVANDSLSIENSMGLRVSAVNCGVVGDRELYANSKTVGDVFRDLAGAGVDYTVVGRDIVCGGLEVPTPELGPITDLHVMPGPNVEVLMRAASEVFVAGAGGGAQEPQILGSAGGITAALGWVQRLYQSTDIRTLGEANMNAAGRLAILAGRVVVVADLSLRQTYPHAIEQVVPGARVAVKLGESSAFPVDLAMRVERVTVNASAGEGTAWTETIQVALQPVGWME